MRIFQCKCIIYSYILLLINIRLIYFKQHNIRVECAALFKYEIYTRITNVNCCHIWQVSKSILYNRFVYINLYVNIVQIS